jgi:hypothetical protein
MVGEKIMTTLFGSQSKQILYLALVISLGSMFWHPSIGVGFMVGVMASAINLVRLEAYTEELFHDRKYNRFFGFLFFMFSQFVLLIPFALAYFVPQWVNVIAAAAGVLYFKGIIFSSVLSKGAV